MGLRQVFNDAIIKPLEHMEEKVTHTMPTNHDNPEGVVVASPESDRRVDGEHSEVVSQPIVRGVADRSAYNCPDCKGEGLLENGTVCPKCKGTGKI